MLSMIPPVLANTDVSAACGDSLLALVNRPSAGDSVCVVPNHKVLLEGGYQFVKLFPSGQQHILPQINARFGLSNQNELFLLLPNYYNQSIHPSAGWSSTIVGMKHLFLSQEKWLASGEAAIILPLGSRAYGSQSGGGLINGIFEYNFSQEWSLTTMLGVSSQSQSISSGGGRFTSINPDVVLAWNKNKIQWFGEVTGQSKTDPQSSWGLNADTGISYLVSKNIAIDCEIGHRVLGSLGGLSRYFGTGIVIEL